MTFPEYDSVYAERNFVLRSMGFETYAIYLGSDIWKKIRLCILKRDRKRCVYCRSRATEVHHLDYSCQTLNGQNDEMLVSICHPCHQSLEFDGDKKRSGREVQEQGKRRCKVSPLPVFKEASKRVDTDPATKKQCDLILTICIKLEIVPDPVRFIGLTQDGWKKWYAELVTIRRAVKLESKLEAKQHIRDLRKLKHQAKVEKGRINRAIARQIKEEGKDIDREFRDMMDGI